MRAKGFVRLTAAVQTFLLLTTLVLPGMVAASVPPSVSASWANGVVSVSGADFGASEAVSLVTTDATGVVVDTAAAQTDATGALTYSYALAASAGTYTVAGSGASGGSASGTFSGPAAPAPTPAPVPTPTDAPSPPPAPSPTDTPPPPPTPTLAPPAPDPILHYIVAFTAGSTANDQAAAIAASGATLGDTIPVLRLQAISVASSASSTAIASLLADPSVVRVDADRTRDAGATPSDTQYASQWSLPRIGWDQAFGTVSPSGSAIVAVLDTGVDASHPDLAGQLVAGVSILDGSGGTTDPNGHGTAMAGIIAASTDNGTGIAGIGYAGVKVMPVSVLGADGTGSDSDIISGVVWAATNGADVILMSFSNPGYSASLQAAIDYAWAHNIVVVAATGNDGSSTNTYPAGDRGVIGVSNTDQTDALNASSNYGQDTFLAAPGTDILTTSAGGGYASITGTSASAAEVAAAAALMRANDSSATNGMIVNRLGESADAAGTVGQTGNGRLNVARARGDASTVEVQPAGAPGGGPLVGPYVVAAKVLTINFSGGGSGQVVIADATTSTGITCTTTCTFSTGNTDNVTLTAAATSGSVFVNWTLTAGPPAAPYTCTSGTVNGTTGTTNPCTLNMNNKAIDITATFTQRVAPVSRARCQGECGSQK